jgi:hypothetical protein
MQVALSAPARPPQELYDFPMGQLVIKHAGKTLIDPFSIADIPALLKPDAGIVEVELAA